VVVVDIGVGAGVHRTTELNLFFFMEAGIRSRAPGGEREQAFEPNGATSAMQPVTAAVLVLPHICSR
jgi:hypothetical protein